MIKIYLGDLVYNTIRTNYVVPLNVAYLAAYAKSKLASDIDIRIFKDPDELEGIIRDQPPDILGLSNYSWNERLNSVFIEMTKTYNPKSVTVMGGPNIRTSPQDIATYLKLKEHLDYYILFEGEEPFVNLLDAIISENDDIPQGVAALRDNQLFYTPIKNKDLEKSINYPSPYLSGFLDQFLQNDEMIPLFETNRGCPYSCKYCTWGISTLSKVRQRNTEIIYEEMDYVAKKSVGQVNWIFCDANFGLLERDLNIAIYLRKIMDKYKYPIHVTLWHSKNTSDRNSKIAQTIRDTDGYIAIQSTDSEVLKLSGRGRIKMNQLKKQINYYHKNSFEVSTDLLIGLPGDSVNTHMKTLKDSFDLGFGRIRTYNIRMLPGSEYENDNNRKKFNLKTKFRPIFGAYGRYNGKNIFEIEESIRATTSMKEEELENFKIIHWLIYLCWNIGFMKPVIFFYQQQNSNPVTLFNQLIHTKNSNLIKRFSKMKQESLSEWFDSKQEMIEYYEQPINFEKLVQNFVKLNSSWIAEMYISGCIFELFNEIVNLVEKEIDLDKNNIRNIWQELIIIVQKMICKNLLQESFCEKNLFMGKTLSFVFQQEELCLHEKIEIELYRNESDVSFCHYHLSKNGTCDLSIQNLIRFLEAGGWRQLTYRVKHKTGL